MSLPAEAQGETLLRSLNRGSVSLIAVMLFLVFSGSCAAVAELPTPTAHRMLPTLPPFYDLNRAASSASVQYTVLGTQFFDSGVSDSMAASVVPNYTNQMLQLQTSAGAFASAIYRLESTHRTDEGISLLCDSPENGATGTWVLISNYARELWDIHRMEDGAWGFPMGITHINQTASGAVYVGILAFDGGSTTIRQVSRNASYFGSDWPLESIYKVGPGQPYAKLEDAYAAIPAEGDADIIVYPQVADTPYTQPVLQINKPNVRFWGQGNIKLDGSGFNYNGVGSTPRAVFQFNLGADGGQVTNFEICNARNESNNGAAVRINQANNVRIIDCQIHDCDMGVMSNGEVSAATAADQWIGYCSIYSNGNLTDPGYNHNLYLGGTSVTIHACEVYGALTGHNIKSRAHFNRIEYCYVHDSANREFDLVDQAGNTDQQGSHSLLLGNVIMKDPDCAGNRAVIHFGQDGGSAHDGDLLLIHNTIGTPFISPVVTLSAANAGANLVNNAVWDMAANQSGQVLIEAVNGASLNNVRGNNNWLSSEFAVPSQLDSATTWIEAPGAEPPFVDPTNGNYALASTFPGFFDKGVEWISLVLPTPPGRALDERDNLPLEWDPLDSSGGSEQWRAFVGAADLGAHEMPWHY
jgi:hypothetical protein